MAREAWVQMDLRGETVPVGRLWMRARGRRQSASFEYAGEWLKHPLRFALEPALPLGRLSTMIDEHDGLATLDRVMATAEYYGLSQGRARGIAGEVEDAVTRWRDEAVRLGASGHECDRMESAFAGGG